MDWLSTSEVVFGLTLSSQCPTYDHGLFYGLYSEGMRLLASGKPKEDVFSAIGANAYNTALQASKMANSGLDWLSLLKQAKIASELGDLMVRQGKDLQKGKLDRVDFSLQQRKIQSLTDTSLTVKTLDEVEDKVTDLIPTGWDILDRHMGGIPRFGVIPLLAHPKSGKTWWAIQFAFHFLKKHPTKKVLFVSVEMRDYQIKSRIRSLGLPLNKRFLITDENTTPSNIVQILTVYNDIGLVVVDFLDLFVLSNTGGEMSEPTMAKYYMTLANIAKRFGVPILLPCQPSGKYESGMPIPAHLRWTRLAEALLSMIISLYNPSKDFQRKGNKIQGLPIKDGWGYAGVWLSRFGLAGQNGETTPGAVRMSIDNLGAWDTKPRKNTIWYPLRD